MNFHLSWAHRTHNRKVLLKSVKLIANTTNPLKSDILAEFSGVHILTGSKKQNVCCGVGCEAWCLISNENHPKWVNVCSYSTCLEQ